MTLVFSFCFPNSQMSCFCYIVISGARAFSAQKLVCSAHTFSTNKCVFSGARLRHANAAEPVLDAELELDRMAEDSP